MAPLNTLFRSTRAVFQRSSNITFASSTRATFRNSHFQNAFARNTMRNAGRRSYSTEAPAAEAATKSWLARMWDSPVGLKTVHFWAPVMKWALVIAGISDFGRPAENLSLTQNLALTATGVIWTRWCFVIRPKNILLAAVNFFLGCVGIVQVGRILTWQAKVKKESPKEQLESAKESVIGAAKDAEQKVEAAISK